MATIDSTVERIQTASYYKNTSSFSGLPDVTKYGAAFYFHDSSKGSAWVTSNPYTSFLNGTRVFCLATNQELSVDMFGALPVLADPVAGVYSDDPWVVGDSDLVGNNNAIQAAIDYATVNFRLRIRILTGIYYCYGLTYPADGVWLEGDAGGWASTRATRLKLPLRADGDDDYDPLLLTTSAPVGGFAKDVFLKNLVFDGNDVPGSRLVWVDPDKTRRSSEDPDHDDPDIIRFYQIRTDTTAYVNADYGFFLAGGYDMIHENFHVNNCKVVGFLAGDSVSNVYINPDIGMLPSGLHAYNVTKFSPGSADVEDKHVLVTTDIAGTDDPPFNVGDMIYFDATVSAPFTNDWGVVSFLATDPDSGNQAFYLKGLNESVFPVVGGMPAAINTVGTVRTYSVGAWIAGAGDLVLGSSTSAGGSGEGSVLWRVGYSASRSPWYFESHASAYCKFESCHLEGALGAMIDVCDGGNILIDGATTCNVDKTAYVGAINYQGLYSVSRINSVRFTVQDPAYVYHSHIRVQNFHSDSAPKLFVTPNLLVAGNGVEGIPIVEGMTAVSGLNYVIGRLGVRLRFIQGPVDPTPVQLPQIIPTSTSEFVQFRILGEDLPGLFIIATATSDPYFLAPLSSGIYLVSGKIYLTNASASLSNVVFNVILGIKTDPSATIVPTDKIVVETSIGSAITIPFEFVVTLTKGQKMYIQIYHNAGVNLTIPVDQKTSAYIRLSTS